MALIKCVAIALALAFSIIDSTTAASNGDVGLCDPTSELFGCSSWWNKNRRTEIAQCKDSNFQIMHWVEKKGLTTNYTLRTGEGDPATDGTTYVPGTVMPLYFSVKQYEWKYRGLLINAVNSADEVVGSWEFPGTSNQFFWSPTTRGKVCEQSVLHTNGEHKPFNVELKFRTPEEGTGPIMFRTLVKRGEANTGEFYRVKNLTLEELPLPTLAADVDEPQFWMLAMNGESCDDACERTNATCDDDMIAATETSVEAFKTTAAMSHPCPSALIQSCSQVAPAVSNTSGDCLYREPTCVEETNETCGSARDNECSVRADGYHRFCGCTPVPLEPTNAPTMVTTTTTPLRSRRSSSTTSTHPSSFIAPCVFAVSSMFFGARTHTPVMVMGVLAAVVSLSSPADAHNWMLTPGRARFEASTTAPCRGKKSTDTHAQVGPGQSLNIKWATGHTRDSWWVVVHEDDYSWLAKKNFVAMVNDYLDLAPAGTDKARTRGYQRLHGVKTSQQASFDIHPQSMSVTKPTPLDISSELFVNHTYDKFEYYLYEFTNDELAKDRRVSYKSEKYPWLEAVYRYDHNTDRAGDFDTVQVDIPGFKGAGNYIVHWRWNGYYDCVDVLRHAEPINASLIDGVDLKTYSYQQIDHCNYVDPDRVVTPCLDASNGAEVCREELEKFANKGSDNFLAYGLNVVPAEPPQSSLFRDQINIPWNNPTCASGDWQTLQGKITTNNVGTSYAGTASRKSCRTRRVTTLGSLSEAVKLCSSLALSTNVRSRCVGVAWVATNVTQAQAYTVDMDFDVCWAWDTRPYSEYMAFDKPDTTPMTITTTAPITVNFQPANVTITYPTDVKGDMGAARGNGDYGWRCPMASYSRSTRYGLTMVDETGSVVEIKEPTAGTIAATYVQDFHNTICPDGLPNTWEHKVANGVYNVSTFHKQFASTASVSWRQSGCSVENVQTSTRDFHDQTTVSIDDNLVEVKDGLLTLESNYIKRDPRIPIFSAGYCQKLGQISFQRVADALPTVWFPGSAWSGAWWNQELSSREPIGVITIKLAAEGEGDVRRGCGVNWFYGADTCANQARAYNTFKNKAYEGAVVSVSDKACTDASGCDITTTTTVCARVMTPNYLLNKNPRTYGTHQFNPLSVDCGGAVGKYVRIHLPGNNRIIFADVTVSRVSPKALAPDVPVCYGVAAREKTELEPEFIITEDPQDPVFYGTCFERMRNFEFLPLVSADAAEPVEPRWQYHDQCVECESYGANLLAANVTGAMMAPMWVVTANCTNCTAQIAMESIAPSFTCAAVSNDAMPLAQVVSIVVAVALLLILVAIVVVVVLYRKKRNLPLMPKSKTRAYNYGKHKNRSQATVTQANPMYEEGANNDNNNDNTAAASPKPVLRTRPQRPPPVRTKAKRQPPPRRPPSLILQAPIVWEAVVDENSNSVYFIDQSNNTQWESPYPNWFAEVDNSGEIYYVNTLTNETSWDAPSESHVDVVPEGI